MWGECRFLQEYLLLTFKNPAWLRNLREDRSTFKAFRERCLAAAELENDGLE